MTNQLSTIQSAVDIVEGAFTPVQIDLIKRQICPKLDNNELALFLYQCKKTQLDPLCKQIYAIKRWSAIEGREVMSIQTGIGGYRTIAKRNPNYIGPAGTWWCGPDGVWKDLWTDTVNPPFAAKVGIYVKNLDKPMFAVARFDSYKATNKNGQLSGQWPKMPDLMIAKCAEALLLRQAFPQDLSGIYTEEEMEQADNPTPELAHVVGMIEAAQKLETKETAVALGFNPESAEHMAWIERHLKSKLPITPEEIKQFAWTLKGKTSEEAKMATLEYIAKSTAEFEQDIKESEGAK